MTELLRPDIDGKPVGYVDDDGDLHPLDDDGDGIDLPQPGDVMIEDLPYPEPHERVPLSYPGSIEINKNRIRTADIARESFKLTPQEELGGGISQHDDEPTDRPLDGVIRGSEDWQTEIREAVEQFGMNELDVEDYMSMSETQKEQFSLHFQDFFEHVKGRRNFIVRMEGVVAYDPRLAKRYGSERTQDELLTYSKRLTDLLHLLGETGIPEKVTDYLHAHRRSQGSRGGRGTKKIDHHNYQIGFRVRKDGIKKPFRKQ